MFFSHKYKILFVATPKTASTAIESALEEIFTDGMRHRIEHKGHKFTSKDVRSLSLGHAKAVEFEELLGDEYFDFLTFAVARDPLERLVSSYFFIKQGSLIEVFSMRVERYYALRVARQLINIIAERVLPLGIWMLLHPYKTQVSYVYGSTGNLSVKYLISINRVNSDIASIFQREGIDKTPSVHVRNTSHHHKPEEYISIRLMGRFLRWRFKKDYELWQLVETEPYKAF